MRRLVSWLWALPALAIIWAAALMFETATIERDLAKRSRAMLTQVTHEWATPRLSGRTITLTGRAPHEGARLEALNLLYGVWGMRDVRDNVTVMALIKPFVFRATKQNNRVAVSGFVETVADRQDMIANIRRALPGHEIINRLVLGGGQPAGWMRATAFASGQLHFLKRGSVELKGYDLSISGQVLTNEARQALEAALRANMPRDYRLASKMLNGPEPD